MTPASLLANARSLIEGDPNAVGLIDRCTVYNPTLISDGLSGTKLSDVAVASNVPCLYEDSDARTRDGLHAHVTHELFLIASAATRAITAEYKIVVAARDDTPQITFVEPVLLEEAFGPLVHIGAKKYVKNVGNI